MTWNPSLQPRAAALLAELGAVAAEDLSKALDQVGQERACALLDGIAAYRAHPVRRHLPDAPVIWQSGTTRLLDYSLPGASGVPVLIIPSLVNRYTVLDLDPRRSVLRGLAAKGLRPFVIDWDAPGPAEQAFTLDDYILNRLSAALDQVLQRAGKPVLAGYCMGGLLALGLALRRPAAVRGFVGLATPWDFHAPDDRQARLLQALSPWLLHSIGLQGELDVDSLQMLFAAIDPAAIDRKFRAFASLKPRSARARDFVLLEDWLNDGVPLAGPVARSCLQDWYGNNAPVREEWQLGGQPVLPQQLRVPACLFIPARDRIVPPQSALALAAVLPQVRTKIIQSGHIGMVSGRRVRGQLITPLAKIISQMADY